MPWKTKDGLVIQIGKSWNDGTYKHPYNWASSWNQEDFKKFGLTWHKDDDNSFDNRFYWSKDVERQLNDEDATDEKGNKVKDENGNVIVNQGLKTQWIKKTKQRANDLLVKSDWEITRKSEKGIAIASATTTFRDKVRASCDNIETKINNCKSLAEFKKLFDLPKDAKGMVNGNAAIHDFPEE